MAWLVGVALFVCGVYVSLRAIAAAYRVLDLWYTIGTAYPKVIRGILGWGGAIAAAFVLLDDRRRHAFALGMLAFLVFYLSLFVLRLFVLRKPAPLE